MGFAERLRLLRKQKDLSQQQLADRLGVSNSTISMYERGEREPDFEMLELIGDFFNVDTNYLLGKETGSTYYLDPEVAEMAQELYERPELQVLFEASRTATTEDVQMAADLLDRLSKK